MGQKLDPVPLQDRDEEEHDTVIDVLSADIVDAYDIADAPALTPPRLPAGVTIKLPREEECVESDTTVYKDGMLKELLEIQAREHLVGRSAGGRGKR